MFLTTNVYIPYDVTVLANARDELLRSIGVATNIGITIFQVVCGIFIAIMVVRRFMK